MASGIDYRHIIADGVSEYVTADGKRRFLASDAELDDALKAHGLTRETQDIWLDRHGNEYRKDAGKSDEDWERQWASINQPLTKAPEGYVPRNYAYKVNQYALPDGQRVSVREDEEEGFAQWAGKTYGQEAAPKRLARARVNGIDLLGDEPGISFVLNKAKEQDTGLTAEQMASLGVTQEVANAGVEAMAKEVERQNEKAKALGKAGFREATAVNQGIARFGDTSEHGFWATVAARAADTAGDAANLLTLGTTDVFRDMEQQITLYGNTETGLKNLQERSWLRRVTDASRASWGDMEFDTLFNMSDEEQHEWYKELARKLGEERHILEQRDTTLGAEAAEIGIGTAEAAINFAIATKTGALAGAALGSVIPGAGTAAGGAVGAAVGAAGAAASYVGQKFGAGRDRALQPKQTFNPMTGRMETYAPGMGEGRAVIAGVAQPLIEFGVERVGGKMIGRLTRKGRIAMAKRLLGRDRAIRYGFMPGVTSGRATNALDRGVERMTLAWRRFGAADTWVGKIAGMTGNVASRMTPSAIGEEVSEEILQSFIESGLNLSGEIVDANGELAGFSLRNGAIAAFETMKQAPELALGIALYGAGTGIAVRGTHALMDGYLTRNTMRNGLLWAGYTKEQLKGMKTEEMKRVFMERVGVHGEEAVAAARTRMAGLKIDELARAASDATGKDYSIIRRLRGEPTLRWLDGEGKAQEAVGEEAIRETLGGEIENAVRDTGLWAFTVGGRVNDITRAAMSANAKIVAETRRAIAEMGADTPFGGLGNSGEVYDALAQSLALRMMASNGAYAGTALGLFMKRQAGVFEAQALADAMELYGKRDALAFMGEYHTYFSGKSLRPVDGTAPDIFHERGEDGNGLEWEKVDGGRAMRSDGIYLRKEGLSGAYTVGAESGSGRPYATFGANEYDKARDYANRLLAAKRARDQRVATMRQRAEEMYDNLFGAPADGEPRGMEVIGSVWEDPEVAQEILTRMTTQEGMTEDEAADALSKITGARLADGRMVVFIDNINSVAELAAAIRHEGFHRGFEDMLDAEGDAEAFVRQAWALFDGDGLGIGTRMGADSRRMKGTQEEVEAAWAEMGDVERRVAVDETLASLAELLARKPGLGDRIARAVNGLFHKDDGVSGIDEARAIVNDAFMRVHGGKPRSAEEEEESRRSAQEWMDAFRKRMRERPAQRAGEQMAEGMREEAEAIASRSLPPPGDEDAAQKDYENRERGAADNRNEGKLERPSVYTTPVWTARDGESEDVVGQYIPYGTVFPNRDLPPGAWEALQAYRGMLAWWANEITRQGNARPPAQDGVSQPSVVPTDNKNAIAPSLDLSKVSVVDLLHGAEGTGVSDVPVNDIAVNERIVQFKRNADPKSGVVAGERLFGGWSKTMAHPIRVMLFKDGHMEVITGRHRLDLAKRLGMETIPAYVYREADGMTVEKAHALDGAENILDKRGTYQDHIRFFIDSGMTPEEMRRLGFSSKLSKSVDAAYQIATNAIAEVRTEALNHDVPNDPVYYNVLAAIASNDKRIQLALLNAMLHDKTGQLKRDPTAILAMGRALAANIPDDAMGDGDLFGDLEDPAIEESRLVGLGVAAFVRELNGVATTLRNAVHAKGKLQLSKEWRDHLGLTGKKLSNDKLREVVNKIEEEIAAWQDVGLSGEMRQRALERGREIDAKAKGESGDTTNRMPTAQPQGQEQAEPNENPRGFAPDTYDWAKGVRKGKDVKASDFERTFGFEKARIGKSEYGQKIANAAYDALASLARAVNVPYEAISLGGILKNIDLGIRGANRNAAYVGGNTIVINKDLGLASAESVANARFSSAVHEWAHALDAALSLGKDAVGGAGHAQTKMSNRGSSLPFADEHTKPRVLSKDVRQEMVEAYDRMLDALMASDYWKRVYEAHKNEKYYRRPTEMFARAVQGYIALLHAPEYASTAYEIENAFYDGLDRMASGQKRRASPYPYKEEVEQLAPVLDAFFNSLRVGTNARTGKYTLYRRRQEWTDDGLRLRRAYDDAWNAWREIVKDFVRTGDYAGDEAMQWLQEGEENDKRAATQRRKGIGKRFAMWLEESFINAQAPVFRFYRRVMNGRSLSEKDKAAGLNVEAQLKNEPGRIRERQERVRKDYVDKINALLREANISKGDFGLYLMALHGKEYNALVSARKTSRGKDGTPIPPKYVNPYTGEEMEPYGSGFTDTEWDAVIRTFENRPNYDSFKKAAKLVRKMNDNALDTLVRAGNISEAQAKQWKDSFSHYVPMRDEDSIGGASGAFSRRVVGRELYHLPTANAYTASVFQAMAAEAMAERNETRKRVVEWFEKYGSKDADVKFRVLDAPGEEKYLRMGAPIFVDANSPQYEELKNLGVRMVDAKYKGDVIGAFVWAGGGPRSGAKKGHLGVHVRNAISQGQNSAMFMDKGRRRFIVFDMPEARFMGRAGRAERYMRINSPAWEGVRIAEALNDSNKLRFDIPLVRDLTRFKARLSTSWNPNFIVATVPIDFINTANIMMLEGNYKALGKFLKNYKSAFLTVAQARLGKDASDPEMLAALKEALNHGMMTGTYASTYQGTGKDIERDITNLTADNATNLQKTRVALSRFVSKLDAATNVLEIATRLAAYKAMRDSGMSADEAAQYGREITVDFNANGNYTPVINTLYMFSNAAAQSFIRYVDAIRTGTQRRGGGVKGALNTILPVIALNVMIGFLAALWDDDEEEGEGGERTSAERNIPDYVWESGAPIRLPFMNHYLNIPMRGAMTPFMKFGRDLYRGMQGRAEPEEIVGSLIGGVMESSVNLFGQSPNLSQLVSPTFLDPFVQIMTEKDWTGRDLYRKDFGQAGSNAHAGLERTPAVYRGIAQGINALTGGDEVESGMIDPHPETLKLLTDFFAGSLVGQLLSIPDTAKGIFTGDTNVNNVVGVGRFVRETPGISSRYYTELAKASETEKDYQKYIKLSEATRDADDRKRYVERAKELASENPWLRSRKSLSALARNITDMRTAVDKSSGERRERLRKEMERKMGTWVRVYERR